MDTGVGVGCCLVDTGVGLRCFLVDTEVGVGCFLEDTGWCRLFPWRYSGWFHGQIVVRILFLHGPTTVHCSVQFLRSQEYVFLNK